MSGQSIVVTGASSGIGDACVRILQEAGFRVLPTVRKEADAESLRKILNDPQDVGFLDVTKSESINEFAPWLESRLGDGQLAGLVNNAGLAVPGPVELVAPEDLRAQLEVNLVGQVALTQKLMPFLRQAKGRIINMSSLSGKVTFPFMGAYCASKYGLEAVSDALRIELDSFGVKVVLVQPGRIKTRIFEKASGGLEQLESKADPAAFAHYRKMFEGAKRMVADADGKGIDADVVGKVVLKAMTVRNPKARYLVGPDAVTTVYAKWLLPDCILDPIVKSLFKRTIEGKTV